MPAPRSSPRPLTESARLIRRIWRHLPAEDRADAVKAARAANPAAVQGLRAALGQALRTRPGTVQGWSSQQLADASAKANIGDEVLAELLVALHLNERVSLLSAFLDAAGVPHTDGVTEDAEAAAQLPPERVLAAADHVLQHFAREHCEVYFATLLALEGGAWEPLRERVPEALLA